MVCIGFLSEIPLYRRFHTFFYYHTFFSHLFQTFFHHLICLLKSYKNIYDLHRVYIENSSALAISLFFCDSAPFFHTFFQNSFRTALLFRETPFYQQKKNRLIPITVRFCPVTRFLTTHTRQTHDTRRMTPLRIAIP